MYFLQRHNHKFLWAIVAALVLGNLGGFVGGYLSHNAIQHALGGRRDTASVIAAHYRPVSAQAIRLSGGGTAPVDLSYLFGPVLNQGGTNACGSFSLTALLYALRLERGEQPATYFSPWYHRYNTVGNTDGYTTMDQNISAVYAPNGGMVYHWRQEYPGPPTQDEISHAAAKSAYYTIVSLGGATTFDTIRYELQAGHPVWMLNAVNDGMEYLSTSNPYTDNTGADHGSHFEVAVGVYGNYIKMRNSWGSGYGQGGYYYMSAAGINATTMEAAIVSLGSAVVWPAPPPAPKPTPTPRPMVPQPTATPQPQSRHVTGSYVQTTAQALRALPRASSKRGYQVRAGWQVVEAHNRVLSPHWMYVHTINGHYGWDLRANLR